VTIILTDDQLKKLHAESARLTDEAECLLAAAEASDDPDDWDAWKEADGIAAGHALAIQSMTNGSDKMLTAMKGHAEHLDARVDAMWEIFNSLNFGDEHVDDSYRAEGRAEGYAAALRHIEDGTTPSVPAISDVPFDVWREAFGAHANPHRNHPDAPFDGYLFDTSEPELKTLVEADADCIWTLIAGADDCLVIGSGFRKADALGYFITDHCPYIVEPVEYSLIRVE
jgi:hypothetical protein